MEYDVIVIGAGLGGLSAGATIASRGYKTLVLEQTGSVGGCASSFNANGFCFDVGATIIEMVQAHDWFYEGLGLRREDYVTFLENDPLYELLDVVKGRRLLMPASLEGAAELIGRASARDANTFLSFMRKHGRRLSEFLEVVFTTPQGRMRDMFKVFVKYPRVIPSLRYFLGPYGKILDDLFEHPDTRRLLSTNSAIGGLPPSLQSGIMFWMCFGEHDGVFYPRGGMGAVPAGMARALREVGGELRLNTRVGRVILEKGRARGVRLEGGGYITSRAVVGNVNARNLYLDMIGEENIPGAVVKGLQSYAPSPSCTVAYLGLDYQPPMRAQHIFAMTSPELLDGYWSNMYQKGIAVPQSVGLVTSPSFADSSLAPEGCGNLTFMTMAPPKLNGAGWQDIKWDYLDKGIDMLNQLYVPGVKDHIVFKTIATPLDFEKRLSVLDGSIYAFSLSMPNMMAFRPSNRSRCVKDLYLCGMSTHVGSVPGAVCSGMLAADLACDGLEGRRAA